MNIPLVLETEHLSPQGSYWENMWGEGFLYCSPFFVGGGRLQEMCKRRPCEQVTLSIVAPWWNLKEGSFIGDFKIH